MRRFTEDPVHFTQHRRSRRVFATAAARVRALVSHAPTALLPPSLARRTLSGVAVVSAALLGLAAVAFAAVGGGASNSDSGGKDALEAYGELPLLFMENRGQADSRVRYEAQGARYAFHFARDRITLSFLAQTPSPKATSTKGVALALEFLRANPDVEVAGEELASGRANYLRGDDPDRWQTDIPAYGAVVYRDLWRGIDMLVRGQGGDLKYEFRVKPGARPADIRLAYAGVNRLALDDEGALRLDTAMGELRDAAPISFQEIDGERVSVESRYVVKRGGADGEYGFMLGDYRADRELVIDPGVDYATFLGGASHEDGNSVAVDASGNAYIAGTTQSTDFPTTTGAFDRSFSGGTTDVFVAKLNADGSGLAYSTYLGGSPTALPAGGTDNLENGRSIAVDSSGNAYVTGQTSSSDFPITSGAFDSTLSVGQNTATDGFVTKLNATGSALVYSTFLGGTDRDDVRSIALDGDGNAYVTGETGSSNFPTSSASFDTTAAGGFDAFIAKLDASGSALVYSGYLGGADNETGGEVAVDASGNAYVAGGTRSADFPTTASAFASSHNSPGAFDAFVTKVNPQGSGLVYSTFLGGSGLDQANGLAIDGAGNAYVHGATGSAEFPTTAGAFDRTAGPRSDGLQGASDTFVAKLNGTGSALVYSTFMGQGGGADIALGTGDNAWLVGAVSSTEAADADNVHTTPDAFQSRFGGGGSDAHVAQLSADGSSLLYGTFLGGTNSESAAGVARDQAGDVYVVGRTFSPDFPTTAAAFDRVFSGDPSIFWGDAFVTKLAVEATGEPAPAALSSFALDPTSVAGGDSSTGTVTLTAAAPEGGATVSLASDDPAATVPESVSLAAGATSATFTVSTTSVSSDTQATISASYGGVTQTARLTITGPVAEPAPRETTSFSGRLNGNQTLTHTVTVGGTGTVDMALDWDERRANVSLRALAPDGSVAFFDGSSARPKNGSFEATVTGDYRFQVINNSGRKTRYTLSVTHPVASSPELEPGPASELSSVSLSPTSVAGGDSSTGTVSLTSAAPAGGVTVALQSSETAATVPAGVTIPEGATSATFTVSTTSVGSDTAATITATYGVARTALLTITVPAPEPPALSSLGLDPPSVTGGDSSTGTVTLTSAAPLGGVTVALASSDTAVATVPTSVTVPDGETSATFTVSTTRLSSDASATITASYGGVDRTATLAVTAPASQPDTPALSSLTLEPTSVTGGNSSTGTVTLTAAAPAGDATVALESSDTAAATVPASVTVAAGDTSATFTVETTSVTFDSEASISASYEGVTRTATLAVTAPAPDAALSSVTLSEPSVTGGESSTGTVTLTAAAPADGATVALASDNAAATVPATVTVPGGATSAAFTVLTTSVSSNTSATISASYAGVTQTATLAIAAPVTTTDTVTITRAEYDGADDELEVRASSSDSSATLTVYVTATGERIGTLSAGRGTFSWRTNPQNITVRSSLGGEATRAVIAD